MERRSFLSAALAWLVGLFALVLPRRGLSAPRGPFTRPTAPADPPSLRYGDLRDAMHPDTRWEDGDTYSQKHRIYRRGAGSVSEMLDDLYRHLCETGHSVLCCDDPERRLWGFHTFDATPGVVDEKAVTWQCSVSAVGHFANEMRAGKFPKCLGIAVTDTILRDPDGFTDVGNTASLKIRVLLDCLKTSEGRIKLAMALEGAGKTHFEHGLGGLT